MVEPLFRVLVFLRAVCVALCLASAAWSQEAGSDETPGDSSGEVAPAPTEGREGRKFALLVGVDKYPSNSNFRQLDYPGTDVEALADVLSRSGFESQNMVIMTLQRGASDFRYAPTVENINKEIDALLSAIAPRDSLLIGFSGHGILLPVQRQVDGKDKQVQESFFCPVDGDSAAKDPKRFVNLDDLYRRLHTQQATVKLLVVDACRSEPVIRERSGSPIPLAPPRVPNTVVGLFSCKAGQSSLEDDDLGRGVFFHYLIEGTKGHADANQDQQITLTELMNYVSEEVPVYVRNKYGQIQTPDIVNTNLERIPFLKVPPPDMLIAPFDKATIDDAKFRWAEYLKMEIWTVSQQHMVMGLIPPGGFAMGSPVDEVGHENDELEHVVGLTQPFLMSAYEVTKAQFAAFVDDTSYKTRAESSGQGALAHGRDTEGKYAWMSIPQNNWRVAEFQQADNHPVINISWHDAVAYCNWLSRHEGLPEYYDVKDDGSTLPLNNTGYRLPTEAEWEYVCRAGTTTRYHFGDDHEDIRVYGNIEDLDARNHYNWAESESSMHGSDGHIHTSPVGSYEPNPFGLHDLIGNVWEFCWDSYGAYPADPVANPTGATDVSNAVVRGGSWFSDPPQARSAMRFVRELSYSGSVNGFRVARNIEL